MDHSSDNVQLVQNLFEAFGRGDVGFIAASLSPDCTWSVPGKDIPASGEYKGPEGAMEFFRKLGVTERVTRFEPREFLASGDSVVAMGYEECEVIANGRKAATDWAMLFRIRDGKVTAYQSWFDTAAYAAAHQGQRAPIALKNSLKVW